MKKTDPAEGNTGSDSDDERSEDEIEDSDGNDYDGDKDKLSYQDDDNILMETMKTWTMEERE